MTQHPIFWPMGALALLTFITVVLVGARRIAAARQGSVKARDFRYGESASVPSEVAVANRNYMNLLELPLLFYVACLMYDVAGAVDSRTTLIAWIYVAVRAIHSAIHLTYNNVLHRLAAFAVSNVVLIVYWIRLFI
jgi:hypothetical protein